MTQYEYAGEYPLILAGVALGGGVSVTHVSGAPSEAYGQSPTLYPGDTIEIPDTLPVLINATYLVPVVAPSETLPAAPRAARRKPKTAAPTTEQGE